MSESLGGHESSKSLGSQESTQLKEQAEAEVKVHETEGSVKVTPSEVFKNLFSMPAEEKESEEKNREYRYFNAFMIVMVVMTLASMLQLGFEVDYPEWHTTWLIADHFFTAAFLLELVIKLFVLKGKYFRDKANWLDGLVALGGVLNVWILGPVKGTNSHLKATSTCRAFRYLRLIKFLRVKRIKMLSVVLASLAQATKAAASVFAVLALILYVFALFLTQSLGKEDTGLYPGFASEWATDMESPSWQMLIGDFNPYMYFGSIPSSMYTLFNMACFAEWQEVVRPIAVKQPEFVPVFMFFALVVGFGFMNVLIAVMVDAVMAESQKMDKEQKTIQREQQVKLLEKIEEMLTRVDTNGDGTIGLAELNQLMHESNKLQELLKDIDFPRGWSSSEMLSMLDSNGYGLIDVSKFSKSLFRLLYGSNFQQMCIMQASINRVKAMLVEQNEFSIKMFNILQDDMAATKGVETAGVRQASQSQPGENNEAQHDIPIAFGLGHQSAVQLKPQEFAGSTSDTGHKSNIENDLILRLQMTVKECIHQEFALSKPSRSNPSPGISVLEQDRGIFDCLQVVPRLQNVPTEAEWRAIAAESEAQQLQADLKECMRRMENLLDQVLVRIAEDARSSVQERASPVPPREDNTQSAKERTREAFGAHGEVLCQRSNTDKEFMEFDSKVQESQARPAQIETEGMSSSSQHWQVEVGVQSNKASI